MLLQKKKKKKSLLWLCGKFELNTFDDKKHGHWSGAKDFFKSSEEGE